MVESYDYAGGAQRGKQADVVMLHHLFPDEFPPEVQAASYDYYDARCTQGSSLSPSIYSVQGLRLGKAEHAYAYLRISALMDIENLHLDQNLREGIHLACAGGTWQAAVLGYGGVRVGADSLCLDPQLPAEWSSLRFGFGYRFLDITRFYIEL